MIKKRLNFKYNRAFCIKNNRQTINKVLQSNKRINKNFIKKAHIDEKIFIEKL